MSDAIMQCTHETEIVPTHQSMPVNRSHSRLEPIARRTCRKRPNGRYSERRFYFYESIPVDVNEHPANHTCLFVKVIHTIHCIQNLSCQVKDCHCGQGTLYIIDQSQQHH